MPRSRQDWTLATKKTLLQYFAYICPCSCRIFLQLGGTHQCRVSAVQPSHLHLLALLWWIQDAIQLIRSKYRVLIEKHYFLVLHKSVFAGFWVFFLPLSSFSLLQIFLCTAPLPCLLQSLCSIVFLHLCFWSGFFFSFVLKEQSDAYQRSDQRIFSV